MRKSVKIEEKAASLVLWFSALLTVFILVAIIFFILKQGLRFVNFKFLFAYPEDMGRNGGVFPAILGSVYLVILALIIAVPIGVSAAIYLSEYTPKGVLLKSIRFATETLAAIPSIIFGLFGFTLFVIYLGFGFSLLSGSLTVAFMILPTIIRTSEESIRRVPVSYREGSLALGATKWQTIRKVVLPSALPGIITGIILGIGRVIGETAAVMLTLGSSLRLPTSIMQPARSLAFHLFILASEGISLEKAYATATVLIIVIFVLNYTANKLLRKMILNG